MERIGRQNGENPRKSRRKRSNPFQPFPNWKEPPENMRICS
nr:MAG TPA: Sec1-binding region of Mso1 [Caudoviricetes sp.]